MLQELSQLDAVAARLRRPELLRLTALGLLIGGVLGIVLAVAYWCGAWTVLRWIVLGCVVVPPVVCFAIASRTKVSPESAARAIDSHYGLKSRALTLWSYAQRGGLDEAHQLVVQEAAPHLRHVDPNDVVPVPIPKTIYVGGLLAVLAIVFLFLPQLEFGATDNTANSQEAGPTMTDGAEMTSLAPVAGVSPQLATASLETVTKDASSQGVSSTLPLGADDVVSRYFDSTVPSQPEESP